MRIIRACRELGVATVAVYSEVDREAMHVRLADEAYSLGGKTSAESYLNTPAILNAVERSGAEAVHPGYGFFSENADFARAIAEIGVVFIGPPPEAIEVMGDKISARQAAERVGVLGVPGRTEIVEEASEIIAFGNENGWPVAVKAAYGGGGKGMKVAATADEAAEQFGAAQREALAYFGRDECYLERYLTNPRHVEIQILADQHGNCVHLGSRDCSVQRRHQKLVEEAPAPNITPVILAEMGDAAIKVARGCDYVGAGTVEFLYQDEEFFYLETNTRLQVEHPATELITGIDLVDQQLRVAAGEALGFSQDDIEFAGHAIEVRVNAEDPTGGAFLPSPGKITKLKAANGFGTRFDAGYEAGDVVSEYYDNLVAKLIVWGKDRPTAIARALRALEETEIEGIATNIAASAMAVAHADFAAVAHNTKWFENTLDLSALGSGRQATGAQGLGGQGVDTRSDDGEAVVKKKVTVEVNGKRFEVSVWVPEGSISAVTSSAKPSRSRSRRGSTGTSRASSNSGDVVAPMQGTIVKVLVGVGDKVEVGDAVIVLEAMKMENNVVAEIAGEVASVSVAEGDSVGAGDVIATIT